MTDTGGNCSAVPSVLDVMKKLLHQFLKQKENPYQLRMKDVSDHLGSLLTPSFVRDNMDVIRREIIEFLKKNEAKKPVKRSEKAKPEKKRKVTKEKPKDKPKKPSTSERAKPKNLSNSLQVITGCPVASLTQSKKYLLVYVKNNNLYKEEDTKEFTLDDKLKDLFGHELSYLSTSEVDGLLSTHLLSDAIVPVEEKKPKEVKPKKVEKSKPVKKKTPKKPTKPAKKRRKVQTRPKEEDDDVYMEEEHEKDEFGEDKNLVNEDDHIYVLSEELARFFDDIVTMKKSDVVQNLKDYVKKHDLLENTKITMNKELDDVFGMHVMHQKVVSLKDLRRVLRHLMNPT